MSVLGVPQVRSAVRVVLFVVDAFVAVTAAAAAGALAVGWSVGLFPLELLRETSANGTLGRGLVLALAVCLSATVASLATMRGPRAGGVTSMVAGLVLLSELGVQLALLDLPGQPSQAELVYLAAGIAMVALGAVAVIRSRTGPS